MELYLFGMILPWVLLAVACWLGYQLLQQSGRILLRLEALENKVGQAAAPPQPPPPPELPLGTPAPEFNLPDLNGQYRTLAEFHGRQVLLVFFSPQCGFCVQMLPELARLAAGGAGHPALVVVTNGQVEQNRQMFEEAGVRYPVLLQQGMEVASAYRIQGTPMGYLIDEHGVIASGRQAGSPALVSLAAPLPAAADHGANGHARDVPGGKENKGLSHSRIKRDGLEPGTPAPNFKLPTVAGGELELESLRGKPVLLVFSDPKCGPCDQVAPHLEELHRRRPDLQVVMVSRGDPEQNRGKVEAFKLTFPVARQDQWEVSKLYAMFATPIAYWIDEQGVVAEKVAVGVEPILALGNKSRTPNNQH